LIKEHAVVENKDLFVPLVFLQAPGSNSATAGSAGQEGGGDAGAADQQVG
jgi:hypothetical protein